MNSWNKKQVKGFVLGSVFYIIFIMLWAAVFISQGITGLLAVSIPGLASLLFSIYTVLYIRRANAS